MALLRVRHSTGFTYEGEALACFSEARMTPVTDDHQRLLESTLTITPTPWRRDFTDYWGTRVVAFEVHEPHERLDVVSSCLVETRRVPSPATGVDWQTVRGTQVRDSLAEFLAPTERVAPPEDLAARVDGLTSASVSPRALVTAVVELVHDEVEYVPGFTTVTSTAAEAWAARTGVCQDMAQLAVGMLRHAGVPARYVSGYLMPVECSEVGLTVSGQSHAWIEAWDGTWLGFDPTNGIVPGEDHVKVGHGRDYADVAPLAGIYDGPGTSEMFVSVDLTRLA